MKKNFNEFKEFIKNKNVAVVGIGVSNIPLIEFLVELNAKVTAFDKKSSEELEEVISKFSPKGVEFQLGKDYLNNLRGFEVIFKTPSMRIDSEALVAAKEEGAYITSEMEEFVRYCPAKVYGITGSDGKTTTTSVIFRLLKEEGYNAWVGGNIGTPLFTKIEEIKPEDRVVLELSSFQLMTMTDSPDVSLITNLSPNHLDMHKGMEEYVEAKKNIFKYQSKESLLVLNKENDITASMIGEQQGRLYTFSIKGEVAQGAYFKENNLYVKGLKVCNKKEVKLKGMYNIDNLLAAFAATCDEVSIETMRKVAMSFTGVEHRNEFVRELDGVEYYNNSIASSPTRTVASLLSFDNPVILLAGGYDKNLPFEPLAFEGYEKIKYLILLGATKNKIKAAFDLLKEEKGIEVPIYMVESLEEAVNKARDISIEGDVVALAPACASFDMFPNFEIRGNKFKELVNNLK